MKRCINTLQVFLLLVFSIVFSSPLLSQNSDSKGTDFWLMFNGNVSSPTLTVFITSDVSTSGVVSVPGLGFSAPFVVAANTVTPVVIPAAAATHTSNVVDNKGVHVTALNEVTVYGLNYAPFTTDAYLGLPTDVLGTDYIVLTYSGNNLSSLGVVGTVNGTTVTITPSVSTSGRIAGVPYNIVLNQGQTYELGNASDLTGTIITSTNPVGVMGANACANIPPGFAFCDHINEMMPPTTTWGKKFGTVPLKSRASGDTWRFLASQNGTIVSINGVPQPAINRGQYLERILTTQSVIESNNPILTAQYANGSSFSGNPGDPFIMLIPPLEQFLAKYTVTTVSGYVAHYINVIAPNSIVGSLTLDGAPVPAGSFTPIGATGFSGAQLTVAPGTHNLFGTLPFGVFMYGFNNDDSYGYPGGQSFAPVAIVNTLVLTPETGSAMVGTEQCFDALVKDQFGNPLSGVRVDFGITGANPGSSGFAFTNASGIAHFCYTGMNTGMDNITASVGTLSDNSTFNWTPAVSDVYYSKPAGDLHNVLTWGLNPDGSGANPADFGDSTFQLANRPGVYTMTADWAVGGTINIPAASELQINGNTLSEASLAGPGTLTGSNTSNLVIIGSAGGDAGLLKFTAGGNMLNNFTVDRTGGGASATLGTELRVLNVLTLSNGTLNTANLLTLQSTATNTARVAPITGSINGNVTVERYIPARRAWRILSAPVAGVQTINSAWQEGAILGLSPNPNPVPGYGTHITGGPTYGSTANGFDQNPGAASSIKRYNSAVNNWQVLQNTNATAVNANAYMTFIRGNRGLAIGDNTVPPNNTTLRANGPLKVGDQVYPVNATGFTAIGNPFASPINFATLTRSGVSANFYLWDPKMGGVYGVGAYVLMSFNGVSYDVIPASVSPESQYIQSGQGFLVSPATPGVAGTLTIKESDKSATPATDVFRMGNNTSISNAPVFENPKNGQGLRINLQVVNDDRSTAILDEVFSSYNNTYADKLDRMDGLKMTNEAENLGIAKEDQVLMLDRKTLPTDNEVIALKLWNTTAKQYLLQFNPVNLSGLTLEAFLEDRYLKTFTPISLSKVSEVAFTITNDPASARTDRFQVVMARKGVDLFTSLSDKKMTVYPNPTGGKSLQLLMANQPAGAYQLRLVNAVGQVIFTKTVQHPGGTITQPLELDKKLAKGVYQLQVSGGQQSYSLPVVGN